MMVEVEDEEGYSYTATVAEISDGVVTLDFNPPLAGKTLTYAVEVLAVRDATEEELKRGRASSDDDEDWDGYDDDEDDAKA